MEMFGERLRLRRKARGMSQNKLGELIGCTGRCISNYEKHGFEPSTVMVIKLAEVLGEF